MHAAAVLPPELYARWLVCMYIYAASLPALGIISVLVRSVAWLRSPACVSSSPNSGIGACSVVVDDAEMSPWRLILQIAALGPHFACSRFVRVLRLAPWFSAVLLPPECWISVRGCSSRQNQRGV